ncbi:S41 family peptidase [Flavobacterium sp. SUN046]|uniref:S41 family peptidase n=1 Tax=Flavobacterium sp. SUN046 TaxID=3002440 RepID=UPI002DBE2ECC|nr:S41 family peptidase [Flavobacterium sp. SUN046]MEC4049649.1 S41 family peptidase [Flavobacterium sp. SUN046]
MKITTTIILMFFISFNAEGQSIDEQFTQKKMKRDFEIFKQISKKTNSGLYKYRTKQQIDSIYNWGNLQIEKLKSYRDYYNLICNISNFEGSVHNDVSLPKKYAENLRKETFGYFPYPIKWIDGKWLVNIEAKEIPLGAEIVAINDCEIYNIIPKLYKYYSTDGNNLTGKRIGLMKSFSKYYRLHFGLTQNFKISYVNPISKQLETKNVKGVDYKTYIENFRGRHSMSVDQFYFADLKDNQKYKYKQLDSLTGILTIHTFNMGSETTKEHKKYKQFLDSIFVDIKTKGLKNLIVDVRNNGGGTDPNDLITYSYLTSRNFQENNQAWISFNKIPLIKYYDIGIPKFIRPLVVGIYNKKFQDEFPLEQEGKFYQNENSNDHKIRTPNPNAFVGNIYLLISPRIASAGSLFAAMLSGNTNTKTIGEETMGGYYGHNGHSPLNYKLPKSKIVITFSVVNLEQDVPKKENQKYDRGIIPDYEITQTFDDFINNTDTQMNFTMELIQKK